MVKKTVLALVIIFSIIGLAFMSGCIQQSQPNQQSQPKCRDVQVPYETEECHHFNYEVGPRKDYFKITDGKESVVFDIINNEDVGDSFRAYHTFRYTDNYGGYSDIETAEKTVWVAAHSRVTVELICHSCLAADNIIHSNPTALPTESPICKTVTKYRTETRCD